MKTLSGPILRKYGVIIIAGKFEGGEGGACMSKVCKERGRMKRKCLGRKS